VPHASEQAPIASNTISTALGAGWVWDIGLPTRRGIGYVFSSAHTSLEAAERELQAYVERTAGHAAAATPRRLGFRPGYRREFWRRNCVAIGLSAGFIEPLEASALALVELSAAMLSDEMPASREAMDIVARRFNDFFTYRWERVIDFLKLHYLLSRRTDSPYWQDNRRPETVPDRLRELLVLWRHQPPSRYDLHRVEEVFPSASYQYVLYGMGFRPEPEGFSRRADDADRADEYFREAAQLTRKMLGALPSNRDLLEHIRKTGLQRI
jgi:tryptophan 7-halogenase